jgi:hypothetical protein
MSITGSLFLHRTMRQDLERSMRVQVLKQRHIAAAMPKKTGDLQDASSQEPSSPDQVQPWPEEARPKVAMPVN